MWLNYLVLDKSNLKNKMLETDREARTYFKAKKVAQKNSN